MMEVLHDVDRRRAELETNMEKLEKALKHWQMWDAEYEGLKEELIEIEDDIRPETIERLADDFGGELLTVKEIRELAGLDKGPVRDPKYIVNLVERRQDYVAQNIGTISKQIDTARIALVELEDPSESSTRPDTGLSVSEIIEELDDDDNVISSKVTKPEEVTANILDTLQKAGVKDLPVANAPEPVKTVMGHQTEVANPQSSAKADSTPLNGARDDAVNRNVPSQPSVLPETGSAATSTKPVSNSLIEGSFSQHERVIEIDDDDEFIGSTAIIPKDESPEDAQLRREMLNYHLNEVGNVVAEMDILEGDSDEEYYDELQDLQDSDGVSETSDISEEEDEHGRSLRTAITADYRKQMQDLERKLNGPVMGNLGPAPADVDLPTASQDLVSAMTDTKPALKSSTKAKEGGAKSVRFAESLDVQPAPAKPATQLPAVQSKPANTLADNVMERSSTSKTAPVSTSKPAKVSRFKQTRTEAPRESTQPAQPPCSDTISSTKTLSDAVIERPATTSSLPPSEPDDLDPEIQRRQLTTEYYRLRNNMIQQQGGFKMTDEDKEDPLMEEGEDGQVKKVSRFKAARLQR
ncbi:Prefoldin subunit-domain-containing protein [Elsinoe ampelina]|uniref:Prefoldin subunit-domain-containing protein n=1 Tax=Elsinoe ampelina TaxID=302913 RepID=A0A6A6GDJ4_9PEZI|nr:Prefoldin subunit-domain-containing protein [Elsinoe ampelina]